MQIIEQLFEGFFKLFETSLKYLFELAERVITGTPRKNKGYTADFASAGNILSSRDFGFCLTGKKNLPVKLSYQNGLIIGATGTGKSSVVLLPSIYTMCSSFIIHDPSGELYSKSAGCLKWRGYEVKVLNFANAAVSEGYNPLIRAHSTSQIQKVASLLVNTALGSKTSDPFWSNQSIALLTILISLLKKQPPEYQNIYNVRHLLNQLGANPESVDALFSRFSDDALFSEYKSFIAYDDKVVNGVIATCKAALQIFNDDAVANVTSFDTINMQDFRTKPVALFIQNSVADQKYYSVLTSLFFEQFFSFLLGRFPKTGEQDIFLLIDEASALTLPTLSLAASNVRKHSAGLLLLVQDYAQLIHQYGKYEADTIRSNCYARMYFTAQSVDTNKELEQILGLYTYEDEKGNKIARSLMTSDEIRKMRSDRALLICGNHSPIMAKLTPYYLRKHFKDYSNMPAPVLKCKIQLAGIPTLDITTSISKSAA